MEGWQADEGCRIGVLGIGDSRGDYLHIESKHILQISFTFVCVYVCVCTCVCVVCRCTRGVCVCVWGGMLIKLMPRDKTRAVKSRVASHVKQTPNPRP